MARKATTTYTNNYANRNTESYSAIHKQLRKRSHGKLLEAKQTTTQTVTRKATRGYTNNYANQSREKLLGDTQTAAQTVARKATRSYANSYANRDTESYSERHKQLRKPWHGKLLGAIQTTTRKPWHEKLLVPTQTTT